MAEFFRRLSFGSWVFITIGLIVILYTLYILPIIGYNPFAAAVIALGAGFCAIGFLWKLLLSIPKPVLIPLFALCGAVLLHFAVFEVRAIVHSFAAPDENAEWVIVLGAKVKGANPSDEFSYRLDAAAEFANAHPDCKVVLTGGQGADEQYPESVVAEKYLVARGVSPDRILTEQESTSTKQNFAFAKDRILASGGKETDRVLVVSSGFHLLRAKQLARRSGFSSVSALGSRGRRIVLPYYYIREYCAYVVGTLTGMD